MQASVLYQKLARRWYGRKVLTTSRSALIAYWPVLEASGTTAKDLSGNGRNGTITGVDLAQPGIGDGRTAGYFDGTNDYINIHSAGLNTAFNGQEGTVGLWLKVPSAAYTDGTSRLALSFRVDGNNNLDIRKSASNNFVTFNYAAGGTSKSVAHATSSTLWMHLLMTFSKSGDAMKAYVLGVQSGSTQTALGSWTGNLSAFNTTIGAISTTPSNVSNGWIRDVAVWTTPLAQAAITRLGRVW
jgi:hypothetical protein